MDDEDVHIRKFIERDFYKFSRPAKKPYISPPREKWDKKDTEPSALTIFGFPPESED